MCSDMRPAMDEVVGAASRGQSSLAHCSGRSARDGSENVTAAGVARIEKICGDVRHPKLAPMATDAEMKALVTAAGKTQRVASKKANTSHSKSATLMAAKESATDEREEAAPSRRQSNSADCSSRSAREALMPMNQDSFSAVIRALKRTLKFSGDVTVEDVKSRTSESQLRDDKIQIIIQYVKMTEHGCTCEGAAECEACEKPVSDIVLVRAACLVTSRAEWRYGQGCQRMVFGTSAPCVQCVSI